jgi:broad specificity phosphatase PhoE
VKDPAAGSTKIRLYALRHGEPVATNLFYGHDDIALSARGERQAHAQAERLSTADVREVWSSDLTRARFGAEAVAARHGLNVVQDPRLREMHLGPLEGVLHADARERFASLSARRYEDMLDTRFLPGGESVRDVALRLEPCIDEALVELARTHPGERSRVGLVVYAHNTVTRLLLARAAGLGPQGYVRFSQRYGAINRIDVPVAEGEDGPTPRWDLATIAYANQDPEGGGTTK